MSKRARCGVVGIFIALLTVGSARGQSLCLRIATNDAPSASFEIHPGDKLAVHFRHSLYGSAVEEEFQLAATGLRLRQTRYGEPRLVEFYGHGSSREENGLWVVDYQGVEIKSLDLHVSSDAIMLILFRDRVFSLGDSTAPTRARIFVSVCPVEKHG